MYEDDPSGYDYPADDDYPYTPSRAEYAVMSLGGPAAVIALGATGAEPTEGFDDYDVDEDGMCNDPNCAYCH